MILEAEPRKRDRVLDEDGVILRAGDQRTVGVSQRQLVNLHRAPGHDLTHEDSRLAVTLDTVAGHRAVALGLARDLIGDAHAVRDVDEAVRILSSADDV